MKHPMQQMVFDDNGVIRFRENAIVRFLLEAGSFDLNQIAMMPWSKEDRIQLAQLIGYSVSGFGDLSYVDDETVAEADEWADKLTKPM